MDVTFRADVRTARWNAASRGHPNSSRAVVDLVSAGAQHSITVSDAPGNPDFFITIAIRVRVYFSDVGLAGAGGEQQRARDQNEKDSGFLQCNHKHLL